MRQQTWGSSSSTRCAAGSPGPVVKQTGFARVAAETDQREQLRLFAADIVRRLERAAPLNTIVAEAARSEPELAELLDRMQTDRLTASRRYS